MTRDFQAKPTDGQTDGSPSSSAGGDRFRIRLTRHFFEGREYVAAGCRRDENRETTYVVSVSSGTDELFEGLCTLALRVNTPEIDTLLAGLLYR